MADYTGRLVAHEGEAGSEDVTIQIDDDGWARVSSKHRRYGAWKKDTLEPERVSVFRFHLTLDTKRYTFTPDDPGGFSDAVGAVVDARPEVRFGLKQRIDAMRSQDEG